MRDFFRRKPAHTPAPQTSSSDRVVAALNGYTETQWHQLSELARVDAREHVAWKL